MARTMELGGFCVRTGRIDAVGPVTKLQAEHPYYACFVLQLTGGGKLTLSYGERELVGEGYNLANASHGEKLAHAYELALSVRKSVVQAIDSVDEH